MSTDDNVLDLQVLDRKLDDGERVDVGGNEDVGNVPVAEDFARLQTQDGGLRAARVGTTNPQDLRALALPQAFKELGVGFGQGPAP